MRDETPAPSKRRRATFAVLRIVQMTAFVFALICVMILVAGGRRRLTRNYSPAPTVAPMIAATTPHVVGYTAAAFTGIGLLLQAVAIPLRRRWSKDLRDWIT